MPTDYIIALLLSERDRLNRAIETLGGIVKKRRGRPPKNPLAFSAAPVRKKRKFSAVQRKQQAARMKAYWAAKRKGK